MVFARCDCKLWVVFLFIMKVLLVSDVDIIIRVFNTVNFEGAVTLHDRRRSPFFSGGGEEAHIYLSIRNSSFICD